MGSNPTGHVFKLFCSVPIIGIGADERVFMEDREIKGITTELLCQNEFIKRNINVSVPISAYCKYDFIADIYGKLYRIQVKYSNICATGIVMNTKSVHLCSDGVKIKKYTSDDIDFFCTIYENNCYLIPIAGVENRVQITLTFTTEQRSQNQNIMMASDYLLDNQLLLIKTRQTISPRKYVIQKCDKNGDVIAEFGSEYECALSCGDINKQSHINDCLNGKRKSAYGFIWKKVYR